MPFEFSVSDIIPATPRQIFDAWLDSRGHQQLTGGQPAQISANEGADFTVWNGYITGRNLKLEPARRIVQSWRTTKFTKDDPDSQIEVLLEPRPAAPKSQCVTPMFPTATRVISTAAGRTITSIR